MRAPLAVALYVLAGCGRISFDLIEPVADAAPDAPVLPVCLNDDFTASAAWTTDGGRWAIASGPSGASWRSSYALGSTFTSPIPVPSGADLDLELEAEVTDRVAGDLFVQLINGTGQTYQVSLFPIGSDNPTDSIVTATGMRVSFATAGNALPAEVGTWSRIRIVYRAGTFDVFVDGALHLHGVDSTFPPPFGFAVGFTYGGAFDNITVRCQ